MDVAELARRVQEGDRLALGKALTLVESSKSEHIGYARELMIKLVPHVGNSGRIGISGTPGVGKSTFIEALGEQILINSKRVAVLSVDPSSPSSGGSILGDKTRMQKLSEHPDVLIRPSPSGLESGGLGRNTYDQVLVCEAAGFDYVLIETVGSGQGETAIDNVADLLVLLMQAGGGDELQGIKRGIMELADCFVINKSDSVDSAVMKSTISDLRNGLHLLHRTPKTNIFECSALTGKGIPEIYQFISETMARKSSEGDLDRVRKEQSVVYFNGLLRRYVLKQVRSRPGFDEKIRLVEEQLRAGEVTPTYAAGEMMRFLFPEK